MKKVLAIFGFVLMMALAAGRATAAPITLTVGASGSYIFGEVITSLSSSGDAKGLLARDVAMVNNLLAMGVGTRSPAGTVNEYYRSTNGFSPLPTADASGSTFAGGVGSMTKDASKIFITLTSGYTYLVGSWDGQNSGTEVWYIGDLAAGTIIQIPRYAYPSPSSGTPPKPKDVYPQNLFDGSLTNKYEITTWSLLNPTTVPDGGTTAVLLGLAMLGLGLVRRFSR